MNIEDYRKRLSCHDWYYYFSDDHRVFCSGETEQKELRRLATEGSDEMKAAYNEIHYRYFGSPESGFDPERYKPPFQI